MLATWVVVPASGPWSKTWPRRPVERTRPSGSTSNPIGSARLGVGVFAAITLIW
jgi:hypothetical protein